MKKFPAVKWLFISLLFNGLNSYCQINPNINSGNPNFPFPQFLSYTGGTTTLANYNGVGVTHAEMEKWISDGYKILCNNMTYNINSGGTYSPLTVAGVKYIMPNEGNGNSFGSCTCVEEDGYYLLAAAYMGDKNTFDGYYMWMHDRQLQKTQRFSDCVVNSPTYNYSPGISGAGPSGTSTDVKGGGCFSGNSALDGDNDVALALLVAWKQWGDNGTICINPCTSQPVKYKDEAIRYIKTMVDTLKYAPSLPVAKYLSGVIGLDGYHKGGDSWAETTNWASNGAWKGLTPETQGSTSNYVDYAAPAYYKSFADMLTKENQSTWCIEQYKRAEASDDWLIGQAYSQGLLPIAGNYSVNGASATFTSFSDGEDFRFGWRTLLNYLWHGSPSRTWDPVAHNYNNYSNTYGYDMALRFSNFLKNTQGAPYNNASQPLNGLSFCGSAATLNKYGMDGTGGSGFPLNWLHGTGSPAVVISGDVDLMAQEFRECVLKWDQYAGASQEYLTSEPRYFHEWFRLLGMLVLSGNFHDPMNFDNTKSNLKIYEKVNKTYAYTNDTLEYTLSWRNYAKANASGTAIIDTLPAGLKIISSTKPYTTSSNIINWNIGNVNGFTSGNLNQTMDSLKFKVLIVNASSLLIKNRAAISCSNGTGWLSNEYPNKVSDVMERNYVDVVKSHPLSLYKTTSKSIINPGDTLIYTIVVKNSSVPFLNGGRSGVVISTANDGVSSSASELALKYRIYHGAHEPLINYNNYRISYYLKKPSPPVWQANFLVNEGCSTSPTVSQEMLSAGASWNHRFIMQFPNQQAATTPFLSFYSGQGSYIHQGALTPQRLIFHVHDASYTNYDWTNDWSAETTISSADGSIYFPIGNDWTNPDLPNQVITKLHPSNCSNNVSSTSFKQLAEEWDGYTWRRVFGSAPLSGRDLNSIVITDTLPNTIVWGGFENAYPAGNVSNNIISWNIPLLHVDDSIICKYWVVVKDSSYFGCNANPNPSPSVFTNIVYGSASGEPLVKGSATVSVSCSPIFLPSVSLTKYADSKNYNIGDSANYTIRYINNDGAVYNKTSSMSPSDWTNVVSSTTTTASSITTIPNNTSLLTNNYTHGKNGTLIFTVDPSQFATFGIALRNNKINISGGLIVTFKYETSTITIKLWNGNSLLQTFTVPGPWTAPMQANATFNHKLILSGNSLNVYVNDMTSPVCNFTNLPVSSAGWVGIINGDPTGADNSSAHIITNWNSHFDSAFDLKIYDPIPSQLNFISAANTIYNNLNYSGTKNNSNVEWAIIHGPITAEDSIFFKWKGGIITCDNSAIKNIAYAKRYGISPDDNAIVETSCGSKDTVILNGGCLAGATISGGGTICNGNSATIKIDLTGTPPYRFTYAIDGVSQPEIPSYTTSSYSFTTTTTGAYTLVSVTDSICAGGIKGTASVSQTTPTATISGGGKICADGSIVNLSFDLTAGSPPWSFTYSDGSASKSETSTAVNKLIPVSTGGTYTIASVSSGSCSGTGSGSATVTVNALPTVGSTVLPSATVCSGSTIILSGTGALTYAWSEGVNDGQTTIVTSDNTYTVIGTDGNGCSNIATQSVKVNTLPTVSSTSTPSSAAVCAGGSVILSGTGTAVSYSWSSNISNGVAFIPTASIGTYTVTGTDANNCKNTSLRVVTVSSLPTIGSTVTPSETVCVGESVTLEGTGAATYIWSDNVQNGIPFTIAQTHTYTVTGRNASSCDNVATRTVTVKECSIIDPGTGVGMVSSTSQSISIYPNPTNGQFNISIKNANFKELYIVVSTTLGQEVFSAIDKNNSTDYTISINLEYLSKGMYYLKLNTGTTIKAIKLMIQ